MKIVVCFAIVAVALFIAPLSGEHEELLHKVAILERRAMHLEEFENGKRAATMIASWYGKPFHGRKRADGKRYNMRDPTVVAHKHLPLGTMLRLENPANGKTVVVAVRDRGPYIPGRHLDLSYGAAKKMGIVAKGVVPIKVTVLNMPQKARK